MAASSTAAAFISKLKQQLEGRAVLAGIPVYIVAPADAPLTEAIVLVRAKIEGSQEPAALGNRRRNDAYTIPGLVRVQRTSAIGGQATADVFQAAMDRAAQLLDEVVLELRDAWPQVGDQTLMASVSDIAYNPLLAENGGWIVDCEFAISYQARVS